MTARSELAAVGSRQDLSDWARRRLHNVSVDERGWLQNVIGALAADTPNAAPPQPGPRS